MSCTLRMQTQLIQELFMTTRQPVLFVSHGAPTFALDPGRLGPQLTALGAALPRPAAVLVVSPH